MNGSLKSPARLHRIFDRLRLRPFADDVGSLFEFKRLGFVPAWTQLTAVVSLFVVTVFLTHAEYVAKGTCFGFPGPAFNVLVCPIYEELIFRGLILGVLAKRRSNAVAVIVSSLLFGILHVRNIYWLDTPALVAMIASAALFTGPVFAYVTLRTRSVWPAVILHFLNNLAYFVRH